jgi:predicted short-subunit dehydrogenase-like oxidoreductase (DUF2520 family)
VATAPVAEALPSLSLVGPGRAGRALARSWVTAGGELREVVARTAAAARSAVAMLGAGVPGELAPPSSSGVPGPGGEGLTGEVLVLAVSDDALGPVALSLAGARCRFAFHLSGALVADAIAPLRSRTTSLGSFHPLLAMTGAAGETVRGAFIAVEGDRDACEAGMRFASALGGQGHRIASEAKALYHAGATLAAGGSVALVALAARAWTAAGLPEAQSRVALAGLAVNAVRQAADRPFEDALTGPVARRDLGTVRSHRDALAPFPDLLRLYAILAEETLAQTPGRGREDELRALLTC